MLKIKAKKLLKWLLYGGQLSSKFDENGHPKKLVGVGTAAVNTEDRSVIDYFSVLHAWVSALIAALICSGSSGQTATIPARSEGRS